MPRYVSGLLYTNDKCIGCNKCVSQCTTFGANISIVKDSSSRIFVDSSKCNHCGACIETCLRNAREYTDDTASFLSDLAKGEKISLVVDPSFYILYGDLSEKILGYLKFLGIEHIYDGAFGAEISIWLHTKYLKDHYNEPLSNKAYIINTCPSVINNIEIYHPELQKRIVPVQTPPYCTAIYAHKYLGDSNKIAFLGPCIAADDEKNSPNTNGNINYNITFSHLKKAISEIDISSYSAQADLVAENVGNTIPISGAFKRAILTYFPRDEQIIQAEGLTDDNFRLFNSYRTIHKENSKPILVDFHSCTRSCINGPGIEKNSFDPALAYERISEKNRAFYSADSSDDYEERFNNLEKRFEKLDPQDFARNFSDRYKQPRLIPDFTYDEIFNTMLKTTEDKRNINCGLCGYKSCKDMVNAIACNYNRKENCIRYMNEEMYNKLYFDSQTGIRNKTAFMRDCKKMLEDNPDMDYIIGAGDLNRFKIINDFYGNEIGDNILGLIAGILKDLVADEGICARFGGGQFTFCIPHTIENLEKIRAIKYFDYKAEELTVQATMRWGLYVTEHIPEEQNIAFMINCATLAMDKKISYITNTYNVFTKELRTLLKEETVISADFKPALKNNEFTLWFQPQYAAGTEKIVGAEALCRWIKPDGEVLSPGIFIPIAEKCGFIRYLDEAIWGMAFQKIRSWLDEGLSVVPISLNISRISLGTDALIYVIKRLKEQYNIPTELVHFEITESAYMEDQEVMITRINKIKELGFEIAMDDFGSGYSSLNSLKDIPIDYLKLDLGFLKSAKHPESTENLDTTNKGGSIISSVIKMAQNLELITIAEGVETLKQASFLTGLGCNIIQGFYFSKPISEEDFKVLLSRQDEFVKVSKPRPLGKINSLEFNDPDSSVSIMFENYSAPSGFIEYNDINENISMLKYNDKLGALLHLSNLTPKEAQKNIKHFVKSDQGDILRECIHCALDSQKEESCVLHFYYWKKHLYVKAYLHELSSSGNDHTLLLIMENITNELYSENTFDMAVQQLEFVMDKSTIGMVMMKVQINLKHPLESMNIEVLHVNPGFEQLSGYTADEVLKWTAKDSISQVHPFDRPKFIKGFLDFLKSDMKSTTEFSYKALCKDKSYKKVKITTNGTKQNDDTYLIISNYSLVE